jgi:hypothetical protein
MTRRDWFWKPSIHDHRLRRQKFDINQKQHLWKGIHICSPNSLDWLWCSSEWIEKTILAVFSHLTDRATIYFAKNLTDLTNINRFLSSDPQTQTETVIYDFKQMIFIPAHSTIWSNEQERGNDCMKSLVIQASIDGQKWEEIDPRDNDEHLNRSLDVHSHEFSKVHRCRYLRISSTGPNHSGNSFASLSALKHFERFRNIMSDSGAVLRDSEDRKRLSSEVTRISPTNSE